MATKTNETAVSQLGKIDLIVIGGAGGFIGGALARHFYDQGFTRIRGIDKKPLPRWHQVVPGVESLRLDLSEEAKIASAGLIFAIVGGCLMPPLQGRIIDMGGLGTLEAVRTSFFLPFICFVVIAIFGFRTFKIHHSLADDKLA